MGPWVLINARWYKFVHEGGQIERCAAPPVRAKADQLPLAVIAAR